MISPQLCKTVEQKGQYFCWKTVQKGQNKAYLLRD